MANPFQSQNRPISLSSLSSLLKKPQAFPFLLSIFLFLTWSFLRIQRSSSSGFSDTRDSVKWRGDGEMGRANLVKLGRGEMERDKRGWILDPVGAALEAGLSGGAVNCVSVHVGEIRPGGIRGNHRHYTCNETFVIWGAKTKFRLESSEIGDKGYAEAAVSEDEVAVAASPSGTAHALVNIDPVRTTYFLGCQDTTTKTNRSNTDYNVWKDL